MFENKLTFSIVLNNKKQSFIFYKFFENPRILYLNFIYLLISRSFIKIFVFLAIISKID